MIFNRNDLKAKIEKEPMWEKMFDHMKQEVVEFYNSFYDDPSQISSWGHHYFCKEDGSLLIYDRNKPKEHRCPVCKRVYTDEIYNQIWVYMYRNEAVLTAYKAAVLYGVTKDKEFYNIFKGIVEFYVNHYEEFVLHNKEGNTFEDLGSMAWGCGRMMPQGLNECIAMTRVFAGASLIRDLIEEDFLVKLKEFIPKVYALLKPQVEKIHNISCWVNSAIGIMGLFAGNQEMIDFTFEGPLNIRRQLRDGVTKDYFWYEGSIHYNFFTLEGISYLALFAKEYGYDFGEELKIVENMFDAAHRYAFVNQQLPNPNDGWPNVNLKTYSYIYSIGAKIFDYDSKVGNILNEILRNKQERGIVPLSKPYYYENKISLERFIYLSDFDIDDKKPCIEKVSQNFETSNFALLINKNINLFYKYGHNGPSHAHPDKMTIEVLIGNVMMTKDLSNAGYGSKICNEWHRMTSAHNTIVVDGENHQSVEQGKVIGFTEGMIQAKVDNVYPNVNFDRRLDLEEDGFEDCFIVTANKEHVYDYFMHIEGTLLTEIGNKIGVLGYKDNGYQHISTPVLVNGEGEVSLKWLVADYIVEAVIDLSDTEVFIGKSPNNPISSFRSTLILRKKGQNAKFSVRYKVTKHRHH